MPPRIIPLNAVERRPVELIEINDVTITFNAGDKPVFTGTASDNAPYYIDFEGWSSHDAGVTSSEY